MGIEGKAQGIESRIPSDQPMPHKTGTIAICQRTNECMERFHTSRRDGISGEDRNWDLRRFGTCLEYHRGNPGVNKQMMAKTMAGRLDIVSHRGNAHQNRNKIPL